ncbi:MAG: ABC transporter permease [Actinomycetota bacterium]|nr:ABC transporter permease [Actinomycetota bacterium]
MTATYALRDSSTMLRRNLRRMRRYPSTTLFQILLPVVFLLLFVYVFGATLGDGLATRAAGRPGYVNYVAPAIILLTVAGGATSTAISVATDMNEGIIDRFRTMAIWRPSVLAGHVIAAMIQSLVAVTVVIAVAVGVGFRPSAGALGWLAAAGVLAMITLALTWLGVVSGLVAKGLESASNTPMLLMLLPFLGSGFVPTASMPAGLRQFATYQPFTPFTDAIRGLLDGGPTGGHLVVSATWCAGIAVVGYVWSVKRYSRGPRVPPAQ